MYTLFPPERLYQKALSWSVWQRYTTTAIVLALFCLLFWLMLLRPLAQRIQKARAFELEYIKTQHEYDLITARLSDLQAQSPSTLKIKNIRALFSYLTYAIEDAGLVLDSYSTYHQLEPASDILQLTLSGSFDTFLRFLKSFKTQAPAPTLDSFKLIRNEKGTLQSHMQISCNSHLIKDEKT